MVVKILEYWTYSSSWERRHIWCIIKKALQWAQVLSWAGLSRRLIWYKLPSINSLVFSYGNWYPTERAQTWTLPQHRLILYLSSIADIYQYSNVLIIIIDSSQYTQNQSEYIWRSKLTASEQCLENSLRRKFARNIEWLNWIWENITGALVISM